MKIPVKGFVGGSWTSRSLNADAQRCINWYLEPIESGLGKTASMLVPTPGMKYYSGIGVVGSGCRPGGLFTASNGKLYLVSSSYLTEFTSSGVATTKGTLLTSSGQVAMSDNGNVLFIVDGTNYYVYDLVSEVFTTFTDPSLNGSTHIGYLNGFFIINCPNDINGLAVWRWSPVDWNGTDAWDALDFANADSSPDRLQGLSVFGGEIWFLGTQGYEVWYPANNPDLPFARSPGTSAQIGTYAKYSIAQISNSVFWLGASKEGFGQIFRSNGYQAERISNHGLEKEISSYGSLDDAIGFTYQQEGHSFYVLTFQSGDRTWVYDLSTGVWHERRWRNPTNGSQGRWRAVSAAQFDNKLIVGDYVYHPGFGDLIYELDLSYYYDDSDPDSDPGQIVRLRSSPHGSQDLNWVYFDLFQVDMETGVGVTTGQGSDPLLMLRYSNDGGHTWSNQRQVKIGAIGEYTTRVRFNRCGRGRDRVWEISISDPVKAIILGALADIQVGTN
jgi:hypothetical protein